MPTNDQIFQAILDLKGEVGEMKGEVGEMKGAIGEMKGILTQFSKRLGELETARSQSAGAKSAWSTLGKYAFETGKLLAAAVPGAHFGGGKK